jgi:hypothetical protein
MHLYAARSFKAQAFRLRPFLIFMDSVILSMASCALS